MDLGDASLAVRYQISELDAFATLRYDDTTF
jgi:hypothetical protein